VLTRCTTVALRAATAADEPYLRRLFATSRPDLAILPADVRDALIDLQYRAQRAEFSWRYPAAEYDVVVADGADAGLLVVDRGETAVRVVDLVVDERHRRRGIAAAALQRVIDEAGRLPVRLSVWSANPAALALYERLGFEPTGAPVTAGYVAMERSADR
jgi:ribosomal protein S18 acetylase RimI-like enzyme